MKGGGGESQQSHAGATKTSARLIDHISEGEGSGAGTLVVFSYKLVGRDLVSVPRGSSKYLVTDALLMRCLGYGLRMN